MMQYKEPGEKPSPFKSWTAWYVFVVAFLMVEIIIFYFLTKMFS